MTLRHNTIGTTPLEKRSARRRDLYLKKTQYSQASMSWEEFELATPASDRPRGLTP